MDHVKLTEILRATIDPNQRQQAEEQLEQVIFSETTCSGFYATMLEVLLHLVMFHCLGNFLILPYVIFLRP